MKTRSHSLAFFPQLCYTKSTLPQAALSTRPSCVCLIFYFFRKEENQPLETCLFYLQSARRQSVYR